MKVEERIEEYLSRDSSYQNIFDFYCRNGNVLQWSRWELQCDAVREAAEHSGHTTVTAHVVCVSPFGTTRWPWRA